MPNEFIIKNGFFSQGSSNITGSLTVTGTVSGSFVGSGAGLTGLSAFPFTGSAQITGSLGVTGSISILAYTASADSIFTIKNSTNTADILTCYGNELTIIGRNQSTEPRLLINRAGSTRMVLGGTTDLNIQFPSSGMGQINSGAQGLDITSSTGDVRVRNSSTFTVLKGNFFGIGESSPSSRLHVRGSGATSATTSLRVENTNASASLVVLDNGSVGIGAAPSESIRLDIRAQGTGSSPEFRVRNSGDTANLIAVQGNQFVGFQQNAQFGFYQLQINTDGSVTSRVSGNNSPWIFLNSSGVSSADIGVENGVGKLRIGGAITAYGITDNRVLTFGVGGKAKVLIGGDITNTTQLPAENSSNIIFFRNGTAPTLNLGDAYQQYSSDITAGNAAPHFRTENGSIIKLYKEIQPALSGSANTGDPATDALIEAMKTIILNLGFGSSS